MVDRSNKSMSGTPSQGVTIRSFQPGDEGAFLRLNEEWITKYFRLEEKDRKLLSHPEIILDSGGLILFAVTGAEPIGCCALLPMSEGCFEVSKMAVTPAYQGKGIGRLVLQAVIDEARRIAARRLYLETNSALHPAIALYESFGFRHLPPEQITPSAYARADVYMELFLS